MDLFGKILVFATFGLSLMMAAVGGVVVWNRVDWTDAPATADQPAGELVARIQRLKDAQGLLPPADKAWADARAALPPAEEQRKKDADWYAVELERLRTPAADMKPIMAVDYQNGATTLDPANFMRPKMIAATDRFGQPLQARTGYDKQTKETDAATLTAFEDLMASAQTDTALTFRLIGPAGVSDLLTQADDQITALKPDPMDDPDTKAFKEKLVKQLTDHKMELSAIKGKTDFARGLDQRIQDEEAKLTGIVGEGAEMEEAQENGKAVWRVKVRPDGWKPKDGEMALVELAKGQVQADSELLKIRKKELQARKQELEKPAVTTTRP